VALYWEGEESEAYKSVEAEFNPAIERMRDQIMCFESDI